MQNITNLPFFYVANPLSYYTYVPINPSFSDASTPISETSITPSAPLVFPTHLDSFYFPHFPPPQDNHKQTPLVQAIKSGDCLTETMLNASSHAGNMLSEVREEGHWRGKEEESLKKEEQSLGYGLRNEQQKIRRGNKNLRRKIDQQYLPELERNRRYTLKYQVNENRNVIPNEINQIFSFVQKQNKSGHIVAQLFRKYPHPALYTVKRFYLYQALLKNRLGHYSNQRSLKVVTELYEPKCENWSEQEQRYYNKICRILIRHFLQEDSIFIILTSRRMKKEKKADHLRARRQIAQSVGSILKGF